MKVMGKAKVVRGRYDTGMVSGHVYECAGGTGEPNATFLIFRDPVRELSVEEAAAFREACVEAMGVLGRALAANKRAEEGR